MVTPVTAICAAAGKKMAAASAGTTQRYRTVLYMSCFSALMYIVNPNFPLAPSYADVFPVARRLADLDRFQGLCPQLMIGQTLGAGHFSPLEVPDQVNAMVERFCAIAAERSQGWTGPGQEQHRQEQLRHSNKVLVIKNVTPMEFAERVRESAKTPSALDNDCQ